METRTGPTAAVAAGGGAHLACAGRGALLLALVAVAAAVFLPVTESSCPRGRLSFPVALSPPPPIHFRVS